MLNSKASKDFWDDLSEEDKKSIDRGLADVKANRVKPYKEVMQKMKNRLPKK
jgi:TRAP-type C4-dicarboxylate transport system substrate-binding protein